MRRFVWKEGAVFSLQLRDGYYVLGQLLWSPYVAFFHLFQQRDSWSSNAAESAEALFYCGVAANVLKFSAIEKHGDVLPNRTLVPPHLWIRRFVGSRKTTIWPNTSNERTLILLSQRPGGQLIEKRLDDPDEVRVVTPSIPLDDKATIDAYELEGLSVYPSLNERLHLSRVRGRSFDPEKELTFDRELPDDCITFVDIISQTGKPEDWGYDSRPYAERSKA